MATKRTESARRQRELEAFAAFEDYCEANPRSPSAVRRPVLTLRGPSWVVLLGSSLEDGIVGFGGTVAAALRAFDLQYRKALHPKSEDQQ